MNTVYIYTLATAEEPNNIRYIGKTEDLPDRLKRHLSSYYLKEGTHKSNWLIKELKNGHTPIIEFVDEVPKSDWEYWESYWISQFKNWGFKLTNATTGGEGFHINENAIS